MVYVPTVSLNHIVTVLQCFSIAGSFLPHCNVYLTDAISLPLFSLKNKLNVEECWMRCLKDSQSLKTVQFLGNKMQSSGDGLEARGREATFQLDARTGFTQDVSDFIVHFAAALEAREAKMRDGSTIMEEVEREIGRWEEGLDLLFAGQWWGSRCWQPTEHPPPSPPYLRPLHLFPLRPLLWFGHTGVQQAENVKGIRRS